VTSPWLTAAEASEYLRFGSLASFYNAIPLQRIPCVRRGSRTLLFHRDQLDAWLAGERAGGRIGKDAPLKLASR